LGIAPERSFEGQTGAAGQCQGAQVLLEFVTRRDAEHCKPSHQRRADRGQSLKIAEIDHMQTTAGLEQTNSSTKHVTPLGDHRQAVGDHHLVEPGDREQNIWVCGGRIGVREPDPAGEIRARNGRHG